MFYIAIALDHPDRSGCGCLSVINHSLPPLTDERGERSHAGFRKADGRVYRGEAGAGGDECLMLCILHLSRPLTTRGREDRALFQSDRFPMSDCSFPRCRMRFKRVSAIPYLYQANFCSPREPLLPSLRIPRRPTGGRGGFVS